MHDQIGIAANGRGEVGVTGRRKGEVAFVLLAITRLAQRTEHQVGKDSLLRLAGDLQRQLLIHLGSDGHVFGDLILARLAAPAVAVLAALRLHGHALYRQRSQAERVAKPGGNAFKLHHPPGFGLFVDSIQ